MIYMRYILTKLSLLLSTTMVCFFTIIPNEVVANSNIIIEDLSTRTELPEGAVNCIEQDEEGFIWIGTWKGLYRYDGYEVINFSSINPKFNALKIKYLLINNHDLWVGTFVSGLFRIDLNTYELFSYLSDSESKHKISENNLISLCAMPNNYIFVGTERAGFNVIDSTYSVINTYTKENNPDFLNINLVSKIIKWDDETVLLGNNGLIFFNYKTKTITKIDHHLLSNHISEILKVSDKQLLVSTLETAYLVSIENSKTTVEPIVDLLVKSIIKNENNSNSYLFATLKGVFEYNIETKKLTQFFKSDSKYQKLDVNQLLLTHDNTILLANEKGLYSMFERKIHFKNLSSNSNKETPDIISNITGLNNQLYAGSWGNGVLKFNPESSFFEPIEFSNYNKPSPRFIYNLATINNEIWFSSKNQKGIFKFKNIKEPIELEYYPLFLNQFNEFSDFTVICTYLTKNNIFLLGTWEGLIFYFDKEKNEFRIMKDSLGNVPKSNNISINSIIEDNEGFTWLALGGGGVLKLKIVDNVIVHQEHITTNEGLVSNFVTTLYQSKNNKIWLGTEAGLSIYDNHEFISIFNKEIIFDIQSILEDPIGFLWFGTQKGLIRVNSNQIDEPFKLFDTSDGLSNHSFYFNSTYSGNDQIFYFGGIKGIDYFTPYKIEYNYSKPIPKITNFSLFNKNIYASAQSKNKILEQNITLTDQINLKYNQNTFSFEFSNLLYQVQEKCQFSYMLKGVDIDWNFCDYKNRNAYYTKVSPGNYTFYLKSTNNDGLWCDEPISINISIATPYYSSKLAYIIYFIAIMLIVFLFIYLRITKVKEKHQQQLKEVEYTKQKELDELKLRFFTNISHEFRTPLTLILGPLAKILENDKTNIYKEKHLMIFRNASRLLQLTNRIMDFRKNEKDQLKLKVEETNISDFIYNIFLFFNYEAQKRNIDYRFKTTSDENVFIDHEFIESVTFNLLSNAFKYTPDGKSITINVSCELKLIKISISDTGPGIKADQITHIFDRFYGSKKRNSAGIGLSFSKRLIELHKGDITVESEIGKGSTFTIILPANNVYTNEEKSIQGNKETIVDWKKIDQSIQQTVSNDLGKLKTQFEKNEMIALIVDDNFEIRQFLKSLLINDFNVIEASTGEKALELAFENIPDIIISDVMMPVMDGLELCAKLKGDVRTDHIPVILTTILSSQTDRIEGLSKGADSYIPKPIDPNHLMIRVSKLIEKQFKLKDKFNLNNYEQQEQINQNNQTELHPLVEKARNIVLKNLDNSEYNIDEFCDDLGLSRMQLYRKFKAITGLSANSFIRKVRLHEAAEMLKKGNLSVKEVTYDVGFIDLKYFRKCFNEEFGVNPSEYQQSIKEKEL